MDGVQEEKPAGFQIVGRARGNNQNVLVTSVRPFRRPVDVRHLMGRPVPILDECELHRLNAGTSNANVRVAPRTEFLAAAHVLVANVQSAGESGTPVHDHHLAMIAEVELEPIANTLCRVKGLTWTPASVNSLR